MNDGWFVWFLLALVIWHIAAILIMGKF